MTPSGLGYLEIKGFLDRLVSLFLLIVLLPIMLLVSILLFIDIGRPIFFTQKRIGFQCKPFMIIKFRTMSVKRSDIMMVNGETQCISRFGRFLRRTSIDELPSLLNILFGQMSFVGPRPLLDEYLPYYTELEKKRHNAMPGLTGLAQVNGRNELDWESKFRLDLSYIGNINFITDMQILIKSIPYVLSCYGTNHKGNLMYRFRR